MNTYDAIMKAADIIEQHPDWYDFSLNTKPDCGTPGCMVGWIGHCAGINLEKDQEWLPGLYSGVVKNKLGVSFSEIMKLGQTQEPKLYCSMRALDAAKAMRLYAEQKFGHLKADKPKGIPDSVRAIFKQGAEA